MTPAPSAPRRVAWIDALLIVVAVGIAADIAIGVAIHLATGVLPVKPVLAVLLVLSAVRLAGSGCHALARRRQADAERGAGWAAYQFAATAIGVAGAIALLLPR